MYISNSNNIGMATLLQNSKNCMKNLSNGSSVVGTGSAGSNNISGNVSAPISSEQSNHQITSTSVPTQTIATSSQAVFGGSNNAASLGGNLVLPSQTQTILLTSGATGATTIISYQQYQQLLQQQQQQRLLVSQNLVNLPIGNLLNTSSSSLTVITDSANNHVSSSGSTITSQGTLVATSCSASPSANAPSSATTSFQQQFQKQLANLQNCQNTTANTSSSPSATTLSSSYVQQLGNQQLQKPINSVDNSGNNNNKTTIRHFSQFSQPQTANTTNVLSNTSVSSNNSSNQQQLRTTTVLINRNNNTIIAGNTTQRLQHATILTKTPANIIKSQAQHHQGTIVVNNMAVQQVINNSNGQIISLVKTNQQQPNKSSVTKSLQQASANMPQQQSEKQHFGTTNVQQIKHQQLKVVSANNQAIPQRATIINSNTITKNNVLNNNISNSLNATKLINLNKATITTSSSASTKSSNKSVSSTVLTYSQKQTLQQQQNNGYISNHKLNNLQQQQPASKLVPNGLNANSTDTNSVSKSSPTSMASSLSSNSMITLTSSSHTPTIYNIPTPSKLVLTSSNTPAMSTSKTNSQTQNTTSNSEKSATAIAAAINNANTSSHPPSNPPSTDFKYDVVASGSETNNSCTPAATSTNDNQEPEPEIDIVINNVVCSFSVRCHLNLREIALNGANVEYRRENGMVTMKLRRPYTTASIWSSGRITCTGATSEEQAKIAARRYARCLEKLGFRVRFNNFRVVNVLGTCSMPWAIKIVNFSEKYREEASYEPELHPGVTYKLRYPKATLKIFSTGSITVTAASVAHVQCAIEHIFPLVYEFRKKRSPEELEQLRLKQLQNSTLEDITEIDHITASGSGSSVSLSNKGSSLVPMVSTLQRRRISSTYRKFPIVKRKRLDDSNEELDADDPESIVGAVDDAENMVLYDPNESIIEGPDDEDEL